MNEYRFSVNEEYLSRCIDIYRRQRRGFSWFLLVKVICALGLLLLLAFGGYAARSSPGKAISLLPIGVVILTFLLLLLQGSRIDYFFLKRRMRKSPFFGAEIKIAVSEDGVVVDTANALSTLKWGAYTHARRFASGFMLFSGPTDRYWWPDSALTKGTLAEVTRLLRQNVPSFDENDA